MLKGVGGVMLLKGSFNVRDKDFQSRKKVKTKAQCLTLAGPVVNLRWSKDQLSFKAALT